MTAVRHLDVTLCGEDTETGKEKEFTIPVRAVEMDSLSEPMIIGRIEATL